MTAVQKEGLPEVNRPGKKGNHPDFYQWINSRCTPFVPGITGAGDRHRIAEKVKITTLSSTSGKVPGDFGLVV
jgi:hypothetical protein